MSPAADHELDLIRTREQAAQGVMTGYAGDRCHIDDIRAVDDERAVEVYANAADGLACLGAHDPGDLAAELQLAVNVAGVPSRPHPNFHRLVRLVRRVDVRIPLRQPVGVARTRRFPGAEQHLVTARPQAADSVLAGLRRRCLGRGSALAQDRLDRDGADAAQRAAMASDSPGNAACLTRRTQRLGWRSAARQPVPAGRPRRDWRERPDLVGQHGHGRWQTRQAVADAVASGPAVRAAVNAQHVYARAQATNQVTATGTGRDGGAACRAGCRDTRAADRSFTNAADNAGDDAGPVPAFGRGLGRDEPGRRHAGGGRQPGWGSMSRWSDDRCLTGRRHGPKQPGRQDRSPSRRQASALLSQASMRTVASTCSVLPAGGSALQGRVIAGMVANPTLITLADIEALP